MYVTYVAVILWYVMCLPAVELINLILFLSLVTSIRVLTFLLFYLSIKPTAFLFLTFFQLLTLPITLSSQYWLKGGTGKMGVGQGRWGWDREDGGGAGVPCHYTAFWLFFLECFRDDIFHLNAFTTTCEFCEWVQVGINVYTLHRRDQGKTQSVWFLPVYAAFSIIAVITKMEDLSNLRLTSGRLAVVGLLRLLSIFTWCRGYWLSLLHSFIQQIRDGEGL